MGTLAKDADLTSHEQQSHGSEALVFHLITGDKKEIHNDVLLYEALERNGMQDNVIDAWYIVYTLRLMHDI